MGTSHWSDDFYRDREVERARTGATVFTHHAATAAAPRKERHVHEKMDPKKVNRESRDSDAHPESVAFGLVLDVTGSMQDTPKVMQRNLPGLMDAIKRAGIAHPQILFGAVGDHRSDAVPLQVGQFESGLEMEDDLGRVFMEGGGGPSYEESYQEALYFFARHTSIDCFEKRGRKGYLFVVGDEHAYPSVTKSEAETLFGDTLQDDMPLADVVAEAQAKYEVYFIIPGGTNHGRDPELRRAWEELLGADHVIMLADAANICSAVAAAITGRPADVASNARSVRLI